MSKDIKKTWISRFKQLLATVMILSFLLPMTTSLAEKGELHGDDIETFEVVEVKNANTLILVNAEDEEKELTVLGGNLFEDHENDSYVKQFIENDLLQKDDEQKAHLYLLDDLFYTDKPEKKEPEKTLNATLIKNGYLKWDEEADLPENTKLLFKELAKFGETNALGFYQNPTSNRAIQFIYRDKKGEVLATEEKTTQSKRNKLFTLGDELELNDTKYLITSVESSTPITINEQEITITFEPYQNNAKLLVEIREKDKSDKIMARINYKLEDGTVLKTNTMEKKKDETFEVDHNKLITLDDQEYLILRIVTNDRVSYDKDRNVSIIDFNDKDDVFDVDIIVQNKDETNGVLFVSFTDEKGKVLAKITLLADQEKEISINKNEPVTIGKEKYRIVSNPLSETIKSTEGKVQVSFNNERTEQTLELVVEPWIKQELPETVKGILNIEFRNDKDELISTFKKESKNGAAIEIDCNKTFKLKDSNGIEKDYVVVKTTTGEGIEANTKENKLIITFEPKTPEDEVIERNIILTVEEKSNQDNNTNQDHNQPQINIDVNKKPATGQEVEDPDINVREEYRNKVIFLQKNSEFPWRKIFQAKDGYVVTGGRILGANPAFDITKPGDYKDVFGEVHWKNTKTGVTGIQKFSKFAVSVTEDTPASLTEGVSQNNNRTPQTGDPTNITPFVFALLISSSGIFLITKRLRKETK